ncbi:esterase-like activity of phytase family protein [Paracoccus sp. (in: a-proteobacteria)]|uniref:esterase-like activity of phytase family protein n=1 Tax=Paracoccus sp. TaxID=267 RepID=UPI0026DF2672|nr:esterase-like activity of phytase family protein [Paracoccus sp. (in: a-proteobacteria)]MDO5648615.1 esterase-like activity of phytase family protein [Paracoccus sp. (in: a-proteobacteria)]
MLHRRQFAALIAAILFAAPACAGAVLDHIGTYIWRDSDPNFGGFSGIEVTEDGSRFHAVTDRAHLFRGTIARDDTGRITGLTIDDIANLRDIWGHPLPPDTRGDSEGIAIGDDGRIWISFEGDHRIVGYDDPHDRAIATPHLPRLPGMDVNTGIEALAIRDGTLIAIPEGSANAATPFTVLARDGDRWARVAEIRRDDNWLITGADFGPDGWLYVLERDFRGLLGFASRIRRMQLTDDGVQDDEILLTTHPMQFDNLEGISVWDDGTGLRITLISDDNFLRIQRTEIVEYRLRLD